MGTLADYDRSHIWHPYSPIPAAVTSVPVASAQGIFLTLDDGREVIDAMSSWWAMCHGHRHPHIMDALHNQIDRLPHVMFGGLTHAPAVELARRLVEITPDGLDLVFFSDSGSVSVEVAMKMALQYQRGIGAEEKTKFLTWRSGYHGDTQGPMSVCDPDGGMHSLWTGTLTPQIFAPAPPVDHTCTIDGEECSAPSLDEYARQFESHIDDSVAAVIIEPVVQGAGGMRFHDPELLRHIRQICDRHNILLIADEIATGFGRSGTLFACDAAGISPDIMCLGKALTGGTMSFAATLATQHVGEVVSSPSGGGALMHGPTFMGNPLACAASLASLDLIETGEWKHEVTRIEKSLRTELSAFKGDPRITSIRVKGAIGVIETTSPVDMDKATRAALSHGVWLRPFGRLVYTMPPYPTSNEHIKTIAQAMNAVVMTCEPRSN